MLQNPLHSFYFLLCLLDREQFSSEILEKIKENLSQSYGRWIVGFHEPMTSALFAFKKGAKNGGVLYVRRKHIAEGKISARGRTEAPAQGAGRKAVGRRSDPRQMEQAAALLG